MRTGQLQHRAAVACEDAVGVVEGQPQGVDVLLDGRCEDTEPCSTILLRCCSRTLSLSAGRQSQKVVLA